MGSAKLVVALYRSLVRSAKVLDAHKEFKVSRTSSLLL